jgi:hypothetical protein
MILFLARVVSAHFLVGQIRSGDVVELSLRSEDETDLGAGHAKSDEDPVGAKSGLEARYEAALKRRDEKLTPHHVYDPKECLNANNRFDSGATVREKALHCFQPDEFLNGDLFGVETAKCDYDEPSNGLKTCIEDAASLGVRWLACKGIAKTIPEDEPLVKNSTFITVKKKWVVEKFGHFLAAAVYTCPVCNCFRNFFDTVKNICKVGMHRADWCEVLNAADDDLKNSKLKLSVFDVCGTDVFCGSRLAVPMDVP